MKTPNVILYPDSVHSACSFWRAMGPFLELSREGHINLQVGIYNETWTTLRAFDIAVFQRPISKECWYQIKMAKDHGLKIILDIDDHNVIPETHPVYDEYQKVYSEDTFIEIMMLADVVITTTPFLKKRYSMYSSNVKVVPNAINDYWLTGRAHKVSKTIFLRAGDHHEADIYEYKDEIISAMNQNPEWTLEVCGSDPIFLREEISNYKYIGDFDIRTYFAYILQSNASIFIVPLNDNKLNRGKSNISWQEATLSGACALVPKWFDLTEEAAEYTDPSSFTKSLDTLMNSPELRESLYNKSLELLKSDYLLTNVNQERLKIIQSLCVKY